MIMFSTTTADDGKFDSEKQAHKNHECDNEKQFF